MPELNQSSNALKLTISQKAVQGKAIRRSPEVEAKETEALPAQVIVVVAVLAAAVVAVVASSGVALTPKSDLYDIELYDLT